jgi:hypothetical protein
MGCFTNPATWNDHCTPESSGGPLASSTGHFTVRDWLGGKRFGLSVSGLMMTESSLVIVHTRS